MTASHERCYMSTCNICSTFNETIFDLQVTGASADMGELQRSIIHELTCAAAIMGGTQARPRTRKHESVL